jgi:hypothetical protein
MASAAISVSLSGERERLSVAHGAVCGGGEGAALRIRLREQGFACRLGVATSRA